MNLLEQATQPRVPSYREIPLTLGKYALVDEADYLWLARWNWHAARRKHTWYAARYDGRDGSGRKKKVYMHRQILGFPEGKVDHRDNDGLHNWRDNLRPATNLENGRNHRMNRNNTSRFKGVSWDKNREAWRAAISVSSKSIHLGRFDRAEDAAAAYDTAARRYHGDFAKTNFGEIAHGVASKVATPG